MQSTGVKQAARLRLSANDLVSFKPCLFTQERLCEVSAMGFLDRFRKPDPLHDRATSLVQAANILAVSSLTRLMNQLGGGFRADDWDFFLTMAGTHTGLQALHETVGAGVRFDQLQRLVRDVAVAWNPEASAALDDCRNFVTNNVNELRAEGFDNADLVGDAVGMWVVINVLRRQPRDEEMQAARPIGILLVQSFGTWWDVEQ